MGYVSSTFADLCKVAYMEINIRKTMNIWFLKAFMKQKFLQ